MGSTAVALVPSLFDSGIPSSLHWVSLLSLEDKKDKDKEQDKGMDAMDAMDAMNAFGAPTDFGLGSFQPDPLAAGDSWGMEAPQFDDPFRTAEFEDVAGFPETCL